MKNYKIGIKKIKGIKEYQDLPISEYGILSTQVVDSQTWIWKTLKARGLDFSDLEGLEVYVDEFINGSKVENYLTFVVTEDKYDLFKIEIFNTTETKKVKKVQTLAFDPKTNLRTIYNNNIHKEWIYEDEKKDLEDKIKRLEKLSK
jgi:hypothetical protein